MVGAESDGSALTNGTTGFVAALGGSEPIMVGGTPYDPEALVAAVLSAVLEVNAAATGAPPDALAIVHDDDPLSSRPAVPESSSAASATPCR